jgi:pimeloyl-ACP methyl ester carboxylesterase
MTLPSPVAKAGLFPLPLPPGVSENFVYCSANGLTFHFLEAGYTPERNRPLLLLLHGYPELAFSWRKVMPALADAGYHVVAFDQRGYGRTTGWDDSPFAKVDMKQFTGTNLVRDTVVFVHALGYRQVKCIIGHDFGAMTASLCALIRPDLFQGLVMMAHPFTGIPGLPFDLVHGFQEEPQPPRNIQKELARLPEPRKHYKWYNSTIAAALNWYMPPQGLEAFLRGYLHVKSADWEHNHPHPLESWEASELAKLPYYYVMPLHKSMPETIAAMMEGEDANKTKKWMSDQDLAVYVQEYTRTGFQGGLNWYRTGTDPSNQGDLALFAGRKIECPATYIAGAMDWGNHQEPGALDDLPKSCTQFRGVTLIEKAGHWPQQEQPERVVDAVLEFVKSL